MISNKGMIAKKKGGSRIAAIYKRVSTLDRAEHGYSLPAQEKVLAKWCADRGYKVYRVYTDGGVSGKDIKHRPAMKQLLADAENRCFNMVLFWSLSRFTRSVSDLYQTMEKFRIWDITMVSHTESFDTNTSIGRVMVGIVGIFAQYERELTGERILAALTERAAQGKRTCSNVLGYDLSGTDSLKINEAEAEYVRFCFGEYLKYKSLRELARLCEKKGFRGKRGMTPTAESIRVILTRPIYCGYNKFAGELIKGNHEPIVSVELFNRVQFIIKKQGKLCGRKSKKSLPYLNDSAN